MSRLDSTLLPAHVRREIRIYTGFGFGAPNRIARVWEDAAGVHGRFGLFWGTPSSVVYSYSSPAEERSGRAERRASDAKVRAYVDTALDCRAITQSGNMNVCWLDDRPGRFDWTRLLARLDSLGVNDLPARPIPHGFDLWGVIVEVRRHASYRAYSYWVPDSTSTDAGARATARIANVLYDTLHRGLAKK